MFELTLNLRLQPGKAQVNAVSDIRYISPRAVAGKTVQRTFRARMGVDMDGEAARAVEPFVAVWAAVPSFAIV